MATNNVTLHHFLAELSEQLDFIRTFRGCIVEHTARGLLEETLTAELGVPEDAAPRVASLLLGFDD